MATLEKTLITIMEAKVKVEAIAMEAMEAEVVLLSTHQHGKAKPKSFPIIISILRKISLGLPNYSKQRIFMQKKNLLARVVQGECYQCYLN